MRDLSRSSCFHRCDRQDPQHRHDDEWLVRRAWRLRAYDGVQHTLVRTISQRRPTAEGINGCGGRFETDRRCAPLLLRACDFRQPFSRSDAVPPYALISVRSLITPTHCQTAAVVYPRDGLSRSRHFRLSIARDPPLTGFHVLHVYRKRNRAVATNRRWPMAESRVSSGRERFRDRADNEHVRRTN
jgi:hypothetical protein